MSHSTIPPHPKPADLDPRTAALEAAFEQRILVMDGATGTAMQDADLSAEDFGGPLTTRCATGPPDVIIRPFCCSGRLPS